MNEECFLDDDGGPEVHAVEAVTSAGRQSLQVRVGPVYREGGEPEPEPGVWVEYQREHMLCIPEGPVLLTPQVWRELNAAVEARLRKRRRLPWRR